MTAPVALPVSRARRVFGRFGGPVVVVVLTAVMGFLLIGQLRGTERFRRRLEAESEGDLTRILASLTTEADSLRDEVSALKLQLVRLETSSARDQAGVDAADDQLRALQVLAGTVPVTGPGLVVTVEDPARCGRIRHPHRHRAGAARRRRRGNRNQRAAGRRRLRVCQPPRRSVTRRNGTGVRHTGSWPSGRRRRSKVGSRSPAAPRMRSTLYLVFTSRSNAPRRWTCPPWPAHRRSAPPVR